MEEKKPITEEREERLPVEVRAKMLSSETSVYFNLALFEQVQRVALMFSKSTMVPEHFRGNVGNCMIALNYAYRLQADEFMVFQSLYEVHGRPGIEGKLVEAIINASNKYSEPLQYEWLDPEDKPVARHIVLNHKDFGEFGCQAFSIDAKSKKRVDGPKITWKLVKAEGWNEDKKNRTTGAIIKSKWNTMPEMMFYYRAASWFGNKNCPELKLGMHTVEELEDVVDLRQKANGSFGVSNAVSALNDKLKADKGEQPKKDPYATKKAEKSEAKEDEDPIRKEYKNLKKPGFKPWVMINRERIPTMPEMNQIEIAYKWDEFYPGEPYPVGSKEEDKRDELLTEEESTEKYDTSPWDDEPPPITEEILADMRKNSVPTISCPFADVRVHQEPLDDPQRVYATYCEDECKTHCSTYTAYLKNVQSGGE